MNYSPDPAGSRAEDQPERSLNEQQDLLDLLCLALVPGVGPLTSQALLEVFGTAGKVLDASTHRLREVPGVGPKLASKLAGARKEFDPSGELELCQREGVKLLGTSHEDYPASLREIPDPPALIYVKGGFAPVDGLSIAIVGSRKSTPYGERTAERLAQGLARVGLTIVAGLARGIDAAAHRGALKAGGRTIAVLANGLSQVYPPEHADLARQVVGSGAVVSEMPMRQVPLPQFFPQRNRIISGLSLGVIVVEAAPRSGSLSTARHAMEQNREVFAVPGPVDSLSSRGCHALLRDGATLVESVEDVLEQLGPLVREIKPSAEAVPVRHPAELVLSERERGLLGHLADRPLSVDDLIGLTGMTAQQVLSTLAVLEMRRLVRRLPGNLFTRP